MARVDLNCDLGESYGRYTLGRDADVLKYVSSCNIACGYHAGDPTVMRNTVRMAHEAGVSIGAHPGFPDLMGFGRREMKVTPNEAYAYVMYQVGALQAFVHAEGATLKHVKPHGALYNQCAVDRNLADAVAQAIKDIDPNLVIVGLANGQLIEAGCAIGMKTANEFFVDRNYTPEGVLVSRTLPTALIEDESLAIERLKRVIITGELEAVDGTLIKLEAHTVCVHGDGSKALEFTSRINRDLAQEGIEITPV